MGHLHHFLLIIPITRKFLISVVFSKFSNKKKEKNNVIEGTIEENKDEK